MESRRRHATTAVLSVTALLFFICIQAGLVAFRLRDTRSRALLVQPRWLPLGLRAVRADTGTPAGTATEAVLLPGWEVIVLLRRPDAASARADDNILQNATCVFRGGAASPARALGPLPASGRAYSCIMPEPARTRRHAVPIVVFSGSTVINAGDGASGRSPEMLKWSGRIVYESVVVDGGDVLVFAKGVNRRKKVNRAAADIRCLYYHGDASNANVVASLPATTSAQQVFRCPPPPATTPVDRELRVTLAVVGEEPIPSLATYDLPRRGESAAMSSPVNGSTPLGKKLICACTMVRDAAKFLREWVVYHAAVGVDRFYVYDNGNKDDLVDQVRDLTTNGFEVFTEVWPWPKTLEAALSHGAATHRDLCEWMVFIDVDEFIFSTQWAHSMNPAKSMLHSVALVEQDIGQVSMWCLDFGPSGQTAHPKEGVTQGYTCRRRSMERHKSLVRLDAVDQSLTNSVHYFMLRPGFRHEWNTRVRVNHYKYQAWDEFKVKFHRRASTYTVDWTERVKLHSKDRTPGLGFEAVEPVGWPHKFCDVNDTMLHDVTQRWFGLGFGNKLGRRRIIGTAPASS